MGERLELQAVTKIYGGKAAPAVGPLSSSIEAGKTLCLVGPSGSGKTTALRVIAGLEAASSGAIRLGSRDITKTPAPERDVAMVFQGFALYPHMSVAQILEFPLRVRGVAPKERAGRAREVADRLGIAALLERYPSQLSGGERQRVAIGRALVRRPRLFLFDEPLSNLDARLRERLRRELVVLLKALETTAVVVTHDPAEAMTLGDEVAVLRAGQLLEQAAPRALYEAPRHAFVASFFGTPGMNLVRRTVTAGRVELAGRELPCASSAGAVLVGVRPEHVRLGHHPASDRVLSFRGVVRGTEYLGSETCVRLAVGDIELDACQPGFVTTEPGSELECHAELDRLHFFDAGSERRLA